MSNYRNKLADEWMRDSNFSMIKDANSLEDLQKQWRDWNADNSKDEMKLSDEKSMEIYGMTNTEHYNDQLKKFENIKKYELKSKNRDDISNKYYIPKADRKNIECSSELKDEDLLSIDNFDKRKYYEIDNLPANQKQAIDSIETHDDPNTPIEDIVAKVNEQYLNLLEDSNSFIHKLVNENKKPRRAIYYEDLPFFTPEEMISLGVTSDNYYYGEPDNDGLTPNLSVADWFNAYQGFAKEKIVEDYRKEWVNKLNELYSDYYNLTDESAILARKQSILNLGWNPEIEFNQENRIKASKRVNSLIQHESSIEDIDDELEELKSLLEPDEVINEKLEPRSFSPVFIVFTEGKTPVISNGIKFFTNSKFSHVSLSFDPWLQTSYSYDGGGFIEEPFTEYGDNEITVLGFFIKNSVISKLYTVIQDFKNHQTTFSKKLIISKMFHMDRALNADKYEAVCSSFVNTLLQSADINLTDKKVPTPADIYNNAIAKINKIFKFYEGSALRYNGDTIKKKVDSFMRMTKTQHILESTIINEGKRFPVEFDDEGNLIIYKLRSDTMDYGDEIHKSSVLMESYRHTNNNEGLKFELSKIWCIIEALEDKMSKPKYKAKYKEFENHRATALNILKFNLQFLMKREKNFNFTEYYDKSPFSDATVVISKNTIKYSIEYIKQLLKLKNL